MLRRRTTAALCTAAVLSGAIATSGAAAETEPPHRLTASAFAAGADTVTLPTGDQVRVLPGGAFGIAPAAGREHIAFTTVPAADGEGTIVIPGDRADELTAGAEDARRYNVTRLAADGHADAAALSEDDLRTYGALPSDPRAAEDPTLTVVVSDHAGEIPDSGYVYWYDTADPDDSGMLEFDENGVATADLEPGDYLLTHAVWNLGPGDTFSEYVFGISHVTIGDRHTELVLDGARAGLVTAEVERSDAELVSMGANIVAMKDGGGAGVGVFGTSSTDLYLMPETEVPGYELGFWYQPTLASPDGAAEPYQYNLAFTETGGFPLDTSFETYDGKLAAVATDYTGFGVPVEGYTCEYGDRAGGGIGLSMCAVVDTPFPSQRLNLYTATPEIAWDTTVLGGVFDPETEAMSEGFVEEVEDTVFTPGWTERAFPRGPVMAGPGDAYIARTDEGAVLEAAVPLGASLNGEEVVLVGYNGDAELRRDGRLLDSSSGIDPREGFELRVDGAGRYHLTVAGSREQASGPFAFKSFIDWSFDLDPAALEPEQELVLPAVALFAPDVAGGMTPNREQAITLQLMDASGSGIGADAMELEVSYDLEGTWEAVELDVDHTAGTATADLHHPEDAEYVSVRTTATDTAGTEVEQTTIWSYGLS
ncbi:hypothetical protein SAMN05216298_4689 [Glycomyces sambucus]|uniref:Uncharacterized protein n=1 Tax=Glycomyces sambucus TaxID=380244 RepID=A0A1G9LVY2_9ACTN|nr:hypothetical protein [Glycomyces sambucus]SDL66252.1 hypothetical protein SAMN05216298_4689 [Glycomyces sambucus]